MPVLFQFCKTTSFALYIAARHRHVALGLQRRAAARHLCRRIWQALLRKPQSQSEQRPKIKKTAFGQRCFERIGEKGGGETWSEEKLYFSFL